MLGWEDNLEKMAYRYLFLREAAVQYNEPDVTATLDLEWYLYRQRNNYYVRRRSARSTLELGWEIRRSNPSFGLEMRSLCRLIGRRGCFWH